MLEVVITGLADAVYCLVLVFVFNLQAIDRTQFHAPALSGKPLIPEYRLHSTALTTGSTLRLFAGQRCVSSRGHVLRVLLRFLAFWFGCVAVYALLTPSRHKHMSCKHTKAFSFSLSDVVLRLCAAASVCYALCMMPCLCVLCCLCVLRMLCHAAQSCPPLRAVHVATVDDDLTALARDFVQTRAKVKETARGVDVKLSMILKWYRSDFGGSNQELLTALRQYMVCAGWR